MPEYKPAVPISTLHPHPANVRTHSQRQIAQIAKSIETVGFTNPIVVDETNHILAGHGRWLAAKQLGVRRVPIVIVAGLSDAVRRAYLLADNKITENAGWDRRGLALELTDLQLRLAELGLDIGLSGFDAAEIDRLAGDYVDTEQEPADDVPALPDVSISRIGEDWHLGPHRIMCGDAKDADALRKFMRSDRASMVLADPPYNVRIASVQGRGRTRHPEFVQGSGELTPSAFTSFLKTSLSLAAKYSKPGSLHYVFMDWRHLRELLAAADDVYPSLLNLVVWTKSNAGQGSYYRSQHELLFVFRHGDGSHLNNVQLGRFGRNRSNVWHYAGANTFRAGRLDELAMHPTVKPVGLVADAMRDCTRRGEIVLDPFLGSGTTVLAAERVGRRGYGVELDPRYVDTAIRRWESFTKRDALLASTGKTFAEVTRSRRGRQP